MMILPFSVIVLLSSISSVLTFILFFPKLIFNNFGYEQIKDSCFIVYTFYKIQKHD